MKEYKEYKVSSFYLWRDIEVWLNKWAKQGYTLIKLESYNDIDGDKNFVCVMEREVERYWQS